MQGAAGAGAAWPQYATDFAQRSVIFWDAIRQRGNNYLEHVQQGQPPVLHFKYETVLDGRTLARPVNYALLRIIPPEDVSIDPTRRPYIIIDPRGGHGPGIGGFKDDSQVGVALRAGHPVYFIIFHRDPEPGQTLLDICTAEREFVRTVRALHPASSKPTIIGNCQAGWAAMMLAASDPEETGPVVIVGAPMSYWGGAWRDGEGDNPMRYTGGVLGGTWLASLSADLGNGKFDGANLVQNFENLNPANTLVDKHYQVFANVDTETGRFLDFERWWGSYFILNREEIEWMIGLVAPERSSLLGLVSRLAPLLAGGNVGIILASETRPLPAITLAEVLATSDLPGGVVNLLTGLRRELVPVLAAHADVDGLDTWGIPNELVAPAEAAAADNVKRLARRPRGVADARFDWLDDRASERPEWIAAFLEMKTVWHPIGA